MKLFRRPRFWICSASAVILFYAAAGYYGSSQAIGEHPQWRKFVAVPADFSLTAEVLSFDSLDGVPLKGWWLPAQGTARADIVLAHGRDANRSHMLPRAAFLVRNQYSVFDIDLRAHGESGGRYISPGYLEAFDVLAAIRHLRQRGERAPVGVLGHSYGAVAALRAAAESSDVSAVISDGGFVSAMDVLQNVTRHYRLDPKTPLWAKTLLVISELPGLQSAMHVAFYLRTGQYFSAGMLTVLPALSRLHQPVLFISGEQDFIAPSDDARRMFAATPATQKSLLILTGAGHNDIHRAARAEYERAVLNFLSQAIGRGSAADSLARPRTMLCSLTPPSP